MQSKRIIYRIAMSDASLNERYLAFITYCKSREAFIEREIDVAQTLLRRFSSLIPTFLYGGSNMSPWTFMRNNGIK